MAFPGLTVKKRRLLVVILSLVTIAVIILFTKVTLLDVTRMPHTYNVTTSHFLERTSEDGNDVINSQKRASKDGSDVTTSQQRTSKDGSDVTSSQKRTSKDGSDVTSSRERISKDESDVTSSQKRTSEDESDVTSSQKRTSKDGSDVTTSQQRTSKDGSTAAAVSRQRKKIVYSCLHAGCGGWGDRQKGIVSAYVLSAMLDRDFRLRLSFPCHLNLFLTSNKVDWKVNGSELTGKHVKSYRWLDKFGVQLLQKVLNSSSLDDAFPFDVSLMTWNMEFVQYLRKHSSAAGIEWIHRKTIPEIYYKVLNDLFSVQPTLQKQLNTFRSLIPKGTKLACAQIRLGKHEGFPDTETINSVTKYPTVKRFLSKYNITGKYRILVTSDSKTIVQSTKEDFPEVSLVLPGEITHVDSAISEKACEGFGKAILDQYALSTCDILLVSESGLAKMAAFLRGHDKDLYLFHDDEVKLFKRDDSFSQQTVVVI